MVDVGQRLEVVPRMIYGVVHNRLPKNVVRSITARGGANRVEQAIAIRGYGNAMPMPGPHLW
eukprot:1739506-Prorocentrum_lima.AAC.1